MNTGLFLRKQTLVPSLDPWKDLYDALLQAQKDGNAENLRKAISKILIALPAGDSRAKEIRQYGAIALLNVGDKEGMGALILEVGEKAGVKKEDPFTKKKKNSGTSSEFASAYINGLKKYVDNTSYTALNCVTFPAQVIEKDMSGTFYGGKNGLTHTALMDNGVLLNNYQLQGGQISLLSYDELQNSPDLTNGKMVLKLQQVVQDPVKGKSKSMAEMKSAFSAGDYAVAYHNGNWEIVKSYPDAQSMVLNGTEVYIVSHCIAGVDVSSEGTYFIHSSNSKYAKDHYGNGVGGVVRQSTESFFSAQINSNSTTKYAIIDLSVFIGSYSSDDK